MSDRLAQQDMLAALTTNLAAAVFSTDNLGQITDAYFGVHNRAQHYYRGKSAAKFIRLIYGPDGEPLIEALQACLESGRDASILRFRHKDQHGLIEYLDWRFEKPPGASGVVTCIRNVTETVHLEQEVAAISQQNAAANRDLHGAVSKLDFRLLELDQTHKKLAALYRITSIVQRTVDEREVLQEIVNGIVGDLGYSYASVLLMDENRRELVVKVGAGYSTGMSIPFGRGVTWQAVFSRNMVYVPDVRKDPRYIASGVNSISEIAIPLIYADEVIGIIDVETPEERPLLPYDRDLLCSLAGQAALTIAHAQHVARVQLQAVTDELTGLYNYRFFLGSLDREFKRANRYQRPLSLLMVDIDHFKQFNDTYGHNVGNDVLRDIADIMKRMCRDVDFAVRYGGEEFAILLPETALSEAFTVAERLRVTIADYPFIGRQTQPGGTLTVSVGLAAFPDDASNDRELLEHSDTALYLAKRAARNCVIIYHPAAVATTGTTGRKS